MSDEKKVISFRTRRPVGEDQVEPEPEEGVHVDLDSLRCAERFVDLVKTGRITGVSIIAWDREGECFFTEFLAPEDDHVDNSCLKFHGALALQQVQLLAAAGENFVQETEQPQ